MKLVIHQNAVGGSSRWAQKTLDAGARGIVTLDRPDIAFSMASDYPRASIVYRRVEPGDLKNLSDWRRRWPDAAECAATVARYTDIAYRPNLIVQGINEPKLETVEEAQWYGRLEAERAKIMAGRGLWAAIGGFATGNPRPELFYEWIRTYRLSGGPDTAVLNFHEYSHDQLEPGFGPNEDHLNLLRYRLLRDAGGVHMAGLRILIGETGLDTVKVDGLRDGLPFDGSGWSQTRYWARMLKYNAFLEEDPAILLAAIFAYRQPGWEHHEMEDKIEFNNALVAATAAGSVLEQPLFQFDGAGKPNVVLYRMPGGPGLAPRKLSYTVHVYEVRDGWWRVTPAASPYWMRPLELRAI